MKPSIKKFVSAALTFIMVFQIIPVGIVGSPKVVNAAAGDAVISNESLTAKIGDLGQIEELYINNNPLNRNGRPINFVLPNDTLPQSDVQH